MKALLNQLNVVVDVAPEEFPAGNNLRWLDCPDNCIAGWVLLDDVLQKKPNEPLSIAESLRLLNQGLQFHLNAVAKQKDYDNALSIASYVDDKNTAWAAEAQAFTDWRSDVWTYALEQLSLFESGHRELVTVDEFIAELPVIVWP